MNDIKPYGNKTWKRLDNMANIFPAIEIFSHAPVYRVEITLDREIQSDLLYTAVSQVLKRFPYYKVKLEKGIFWTYLEQNKKNIVVHKDTVSPCIGINYRKNNHYLFKVKYFENTIALEIYHALTDGGGAMIFLNTLAAQYLRLCGIAIQPNEKYGIWNLSSAVKPEEYEDSFYKYYDKSKKSLGLKSSAYHYKGTKEKQDNIKYIKAELVASEVIERSRSLGLSVTGYLTSVYIHTLYTLQKKSSGKKPIRLSVPINLRNIFPSITMRNFTYFILCEVLPELNDDLSFHDIANSVKESLNIGINKDELINNFSGNVNSEQNIFVRLLPLKLKLLLLSLIYTKRGENQYSGSLSNLGLIKLPSDMMPYVKEYCCFLSPNSINVTSCGVVGYSNKLFITFTRNVKENEIEHLFFKALAQDNLNIILDSNYCD